jgi:hypothetical protein
MASGGQINKAFGNSPEKKGVVGEKRWAQNN